MKKITEVKGKGIYVEGDDIDTDRIIPARYLKVLDFSTLGNYVFQDVRFDQNGKQTTHPFNNKKYQGASILVVNKNFGCGSSREHAPVALIGWGIKAVIGESFAEIFAGNCIANGIPVVVAPHDDITNIMKFIQDDPVSEIKIDLIGNKVEYGDFSFDIHQQDGHKKSLVEGTWDTMGEMLDHKNETEKIRNALPYIKGFS